MFVGIEDTPSECGDSETRDPSSELGHRGRKSMFDGVWFVVKIYSLLVVDVFRVHNLQTCIRRVHGG